MGVYTNKDLKLTPFCFQGRPGRQGPQGAPGEKGSRVSEHADITAWEDDLFCLCNDKRSQVYCQDENKPGRRTSVLTWKLHEKQRPGGTLAGKFDEYNFIFIFRICEFYLHFVVREKKEPAESLDPRENLALP